MKKISPLSPWRKLPLSPWRKFPLSHHEESFPYNHEESFPSHHEESFPSHHEESFLSLIMRKVSPLITKKVFPLSHHEESFRRKKNFLCLDTSVGNLSSRRTDLHLGDTQSPHLKEITFFKSFIPSYRSPPRRHTEPSPQIDLFFKSDA